MNPFDSQKTINPGVMGNIKVDVSDRSININGDFVLDSLNLYKNYSYRISDDNMFITIYGSSASSKYDSGNFNISLDGSFSEINNIYFESDEEQLLIWQRGDKGIT